MVAHRLKVDCEKCDKKATRLVVDHPDALPPIYLCDGTLLPPDQITRKFLCATCDNGKWHVVHLLAKTRQK